MQVHISGWIVLGVIVVGMVVFDIFAHIRSPHEPTIKESAIWSSIYIGFGLAFGLLVWAAWGGRYALEYYAGYLTEESLSLDNLFVFIIIITAFRVPRRDQQRVLLWGIVFALILRFTFILLGAAAVNAFAGIFYVFGFFLIYTAIKQVRDGMGDDEDEYSEGRFTRVMRKIFPVTEGFVGDKFFHRHSGKTYITPMFLCLIAIGSTDLMFAMDSIPAIFGLTREPFLVFATNAFSLLGLRQLYFLLDGLLQRLVFLNWGLGAILGFIGVKLIVHALHEAPIFGSQNWAHAIPEPSIGVSITFIAVVLVLTTIASLWYTRRLERSN
ncbi:MAG: TerC family protein [Actinomycetaceae bacterium]|nr:TerC family protein [Actinomycetaceae bacterium]